MRLLSFLKKFLTLQLVGGVITSIYASYAVLPSTFQLLLLIVFIVGVLCFLMLCPCAGVVCKVKCMSLVHVLHYLAGAVAPDLPVWKPLQLVFLVINVSFSAFAWYFYFA